MVAPGSTHGSCRPEAAAAVQTIAPAPALSASVVLPQQNLGQCAAAGCPKVQDSPALLLLQQQQLLLQSSTQQTPAAAAGALLLPHLRQGKH
jgi:hypothetical protein